MCFRDNNYLGRLQDSEKKKPSFFICLRRGRGMLHICLVTFISFLSFTKVHLFIYAPKSSSFISSFISISFISKIKVHLIHIHHIWLYLYCIIFRPHCDFHFFNQSCLYKLGVSLDKILIQNIYCIMWSWTPMVLLLLVTS